MAASRRKVAAIAVPTALAASATALGALSGPPSSEQVAADVVFTHAAIRERDCTAKDGTPFAEQIVTATGTSTGDPRLTGEFTYKTHVLVNLGSGGSTDVATMRVRDASGAWKAQGEVRAAGVEEIGQGFVAGETRDPATSRGDRMRLFANFRTTFHPNGAITSQIGGTAADGRLPAVVIGGGCSGPYFSFEVDLPGPDDPPGPGVRSGSGRWG